MFKKFIASALLCSAALSSNVNANLIVDLELQLLADVSGSVDSSEYALQLNGYSDAFRSTSVINSILAGTNGSIAVQYIEWSGAAQQAVQVDWALIDSALSANAFADALDAVSRAFSGTTAIGSAINFGYGLFDTNDYDSARQVIDVSGDGTQNDGSNTATARDNAIAAGVDVINGITIGSSSALETFYINNVIAGQNAFHINAASFADFKTGIERKLLREIKGPDPVSEPASIALLGLSVLGFMRLRRKA